MQLWKTQNPLYYVCFKLNNNKLFHFSRPKINPSYHGRKKFIGTS